MAEKKEENQPKADQPEAEKKEVPKEFKDLVEKIEKMSVLELSELVKVLEDKFGVSASQPMMVAGGAPVATGGDSDEEEKSSFNIELKSTGDQKINVIKAIREVTELSLKDAKDLVDGAPQVVKESVPKEQAEEMKKKLEEAGATVELK